MDRILSWLGCFGGILLVIMFALGVTESIKYVGWLERTLVLLAAVAVAACVAYLRDRMKHGGPVADRSPQPATPVEQHRIDRLAQRSREQPSKVDASGWMPAQAAPFSPAPPAVSPEIPDAILAARRQAILFRQIVPPNHDPSHLSYFGGLPTGPHSLEWPRGPSKPLSFLMQIDLRAVPPAGRLGLLPAEGVLYLFLDLEWAEGIPFQFVHEPGPTDGWSEIAAPSDLPHAFSHRAMWKWPQSDADWPRLLPKWPFDPVLIEGGPLPDDEEELEASYAWPGTVSPGESIPAIEGGVVTHRGFWQEGGQAKTGRPFDAFPQDWNAVRIACGLIAHGKKRQVPGARSRRFQDLSDEEFAAIVANGEARLAEWTARAAAAEPFAAVPTEEREEFLAWLDENQWLTHLPLGDAGALSVEASLTAGPEAAARVPAEVLDFIGSRHSLATELDGRMHINIPDRMLAAPVDVQGDIDERAREFLLLLELSSNEGLAHYFGEGVFQFWIRPEDLAAARFDRVELSTTAY